MAKQINEAKFGNVRALLTSTLCEYIDCFIDVSKSGAYYDPNMLLNKILEGLLDSDKIAAIKTLRAAVQGMQSSLTFSIAKNPDLRDALHSAVSLVNDHGTTCVVCSMGEHSATLYFARGRFGLKDAKDFIDLVDNILIAGEMYL